MPPWPSHCADILGVVLKNPFIWRDSQFRCKCPKSELLYSNWKWAQWSLFSWFRCYISSAASISKQMWRRKTSKGVSEQIIPMSRLFPNPALLLPQLARASFVKTMISLFSLLTEVSYLSLLVCSLVTSTEEKMCVLACLGFLAWFPKERGIMQLYLYVCAHACFKKL